MNTVPHSILCFLAFLTFLVASSVRALAAVAVDTPPSAPRVVINEILYHPPEDRDELQWVELWNPGSRPVDLAGWSFRKGLKFTFTNSLTLAPQAFLVVSRDRVAFRLRYGTNLPVVGDFAGRLSHAGEKIELVDRQGTTVDEVKFGTGQGWPSSPDGLSASLERRLAQVTGDDPDNWAPSILPPRKRAGGTPGQPNHVAATNLPPRIADVTFPPPTPGQPLRLAARVTDPDGVREVRLVYQVLDPANSSTKPAEAAPPEIALAPAPAGTDADAGVYSGTIPAQPEGRLVRFHLRAVDRLGNERLLPDPDDIRPDWTVYTGRNTHDGKIPAVVLAPFGPPEPAGAGLRNGFGPGARRGRLAEPGEPTRGQAAMIHFPTDGSPPVVRDFIRITPRQGGWKVRFQKDQLLDGMSTANVIFEFQPRSVLSEHLAYEVYRAAGVAAPNSGHWRVTFAGRPLGYYLFVEQPNSQFLRRHRFDTQGEIFKLLWYGGDLIGQHEKKNRPETGHAALAQTVDALRQSSGAEQWRVIQERFDVDSFVNYYAVNQCIQNWDGFFNNYFLYRQPGPRGKWVIIPWDEDKTWGDYDGSPADHSWYEMPLTFGMTGDHPPRGLAALKGGVGPHGGPSWWRSPGWFSGPLLANPQFRARFLARVKELCQTTFTPEKLEPTFHQLEQRLEPEVRLRAGLRSRGPNGRGPNPGWSPDEPPTGNATAALDQFHRHMASFRNQVTRRREFLLRELDRGPNR